MLLKRLRRWFAERIDDLADELVAELGHVSVVGLGPQSHQRQTIPPYAP
jgi:hypothetical protein